MPLDNISFGYSYLADNSRTSFPALGIPNFTETPEEDSELRSICGFSVQGRGLTTASTILDAHIKGFGSALGSTNLPDPSTLTNSDVKDYSETGSGLIRFTMSDASGTEFLDTNDITNRTDCDASGDPVTLPIHKGWRREEILRGEYIHGFAQKDGYFLTYIIHYPSFFEFFGNSGYYSSFTDRMADYTSQLTLLELSPNAISPQADSVQSLMAVDIFAADPSEDIPSITTAVNDTISTELASLYASPSTHYQNIVFCRNDQAGALGLSQDFTPCYISDISGLDNCPWSVTDASTELYTYLTSDFKGDILLSEGFNMDIDTRSPVFTFNAVAGAGAGYGPPCDEDNDQQPDSVIRELNSVGPDDVGNVYLGGDKCLMVGPNINTGAAESGSDDTGTSAITSCRMFGGHPSATAGITNGLNSPSLMLSGFCSQCCPCGEYENLYKALEKVASPLWTSINSHPCPSTGCDPENYTWSMAGLLHKVNRTTQHYKCIVDQYNDFVECLPDIVVSAAGTGHYGYLVSAQVLVQNHGPDRLVGDMTVEFDLGAVGDVEAVKNTSYANLDASNTTESDFNPAQPLESLGTTIESSGSKVTLTGGFLNNVTIERGRYMMIGVLVYLKASAAAVNDPCDPALNKVLTATVSGLTSSPQSDTNNYECLSTLFLAAPCTPPIPNMVWVEGDTLNLKMTDDTVSGASISVSIEWEYVWQDWVPSNEEGTDFLDVCGHSVTYGGNHGSEGDSSDGHSVTFSGDTASLSLVGIVPDSPSSLWDLPSSMDIYGQCDDCDDPTLPCAGCQYPAYASSIQLTVSYGGGVWVSCESTGDTIEIEDFTTEAGILATSLPPTVFYHCCTSAGADCHTLG